jgi:hypothetical protein
MQSDTGRFHAGTVGGTPLEAAAGMDADSAPLPAGERIGLPVQNVSHANRRMAAIRS